MRHAPLLVVCTLAATFTGSAIAASNSTTLQTDYSRAQTYRSMSSDTDSTRSDAEDCVGRECTKAATGAGKSPTRRSTARDDSVRPRWHSTLPGMIR